MLLDYGNDLMKVLHSIDGHLSDIQTKLESQGGEPDAEESTADAQVQSLDYTDKLDGIQNSLQNIETSVIIPKQFISEFSEQVSETADYTETLDNLSNLFVVVIFLFGITCGLISAKMMWEKVRA